MSFKDKCRKLLLIGGLGLGLLAGAPLRPEEIEELLQRASQAKLVHVLRQEADRPQNDSKPN